MSPAKRKARVASAVTRALEKLLARIPDSDEAPASDPRARSLRLRTLAAREAAGISTTLSLPPGPLGMLTVVPDLVAIWKVQSRLVADIASAYGKSASLTRATMVHCLFKHAGAALLRDVIVRAAERAVVRRASLRVVGRSLARWLPLAGAVGVGAYAYYDTKRVGDTAIELFSRERDPVQG